MKPTKKWRIFFVNDMKMFIIEVQNSLGKRKEEREEPHLVSHVHKSSLKDGMLLSLFSPTIQVALLQLSRLVLPLEGFHFLRLLLSFLIWLL